MYVTNNTNYSFLANQNTDKDMSPQIIRIETEKDRNGNNKEVLVLKFFCRVDKDLIKKSSCEKIDIRLSKFDLSYYRSKSKLTQTKVVVSKMKQQQKKTNLTDSAEIENAIQSRQQKRKNQKNKRKNKKEEKRNRRRSRRENARKGVESLFPRNKNNSGDRRSRRRGGNKNRDKNSKFKNNNSSIRVSPVKKALNSKVVLEPKNLVITSKSAASFNLVKNQDVYGEAKKITAINFGATSTSNLLRRNQNRTQRLSFNSRQRSNKDQFLKPDIMLKIEKSKDPSIYRNKNLYRSNSNTLKNYKNHYINLIDKSIDPMKHFQISIDKDSADHQRKGIKTLKNSTSNLSKQSKSLLTELRRQIGQISNTRYEFKKVVNPSRYKIVECIGRISLQDFQNLGRKAYVLYIAKDSFGINLQSQEYAIQTNEILKQRIIQATRVDCNVTRNPAGVSRLIISNTELKPLDIDVEVKKLKRQTNFLESNYDEIIGNQKIQPKSSTVLIDGKVGGRAKRAINFSAIDNLFFRTTLNYRDKKYNNSFCASIKGVKGTGRNDNIPNLNIIAIIDEKSRGINIQLSGMSENIAAVKLVKYRYTGGAKGKLIETFDSEGNVNTFTFLDSKEIKNSISFFDSDVFQDKVYMYTVECIMSNGERKLATDYFIEKFEERTETVLIGKVVVDSPNFIADASSSISEEREATRQVSLNFNVSKIQTEVDKVISNLFGNLFEIYKDELTKIKDVQGLVYSIEVQRIELQTGNNATVGKVTADKEGNCVFVDENAPAFLDLTYKLIPRVRPANEVITSIIAQTPFLAKKTIAQPINYVSAAARVNAKNRNDRVYTAKQDKFNQRSMFKKGRVRSAKNVLEQNSEDLFADSSTGDISYVQVGGLSESRFLDRIRVSAGDVSEVKHVSSLTTNTNNLVTEEKYYELSFVTNNDYLVDFYVLFIKEGNNIYVDGTIHSTDILREEKNYNYLVVHEGSRGVIEYYIVPILKNGKVMSPKLVSAQLIR